jgi:ribose-phosphate pyrophosphokinase
MSQNKLKIFCGNANPELAQEICDYLGEPLGAATVKSFPDGETFVRIDENIRGADVFIIQPTSNPANQHLMELFIMIDAARRASAKRITAVIPFYGYARQDRKDQPRVPITSKLVANLLVSSGANRVLTVDLHAQQIQGFFDIPVDHLYASPVLFKYLKNIDTDNLTLFSPDVGGMKMASAYAGLLNVPIGFIAKRRTSAETVEAVSLVGETEGRDILLIDDMTETAGTLCAAAELLKKNGAGACDGGSQSWCFERARVRAAFFGHSGSADYYQYNARSTARGCPDHGTQCRRTTRRGNSPNS